MSFFLQLVFNKDHIQLALLSSQSSKAPFEFGHLNSTVAAKAGPAPSDRTPDTASSGCSIPSLVERTPTIQHSLRPTPSLPSPEIVVPPPRRPQRIEVISHLLCFALIFYLCDSHPRMITQLQVCHRSRLIAVPMGAPVGNPILPVEEIMTRPKWRLTLKARALLFSLRQSCPLYFVFIGLMSSRNTM